MSHKYAFFLHFFPHIKMNLWKKSEAATCRQLKFRRAKLKAVIALPKNGSQYEAAKWALDRLNVDSVQVSTTEEVLKACFINRDGCGSKKGSIFNNVSGNNAAPSSENKEAIVPNLVILDARSSKQIDCDAIARYINILRLYFLVCKKKSRSTLTTN